MAGQQFSKDFLTQNKSIPRLEILEDLHFDGLQDLNGVKEDRNIRQTFT